jgi:hypothetical protein
VVAAASARTRGWPATHRRPSTESIRLVYHRAWRSRSKTWPASSRRRLASSWDVQQAHHPNSGAASRHSSSVVGGVLASLWLCRVSGGCRGDYAADVRCDCGVRSGSSVVAPRHRCSLGDRPSARCPTRRPTLRATVPTWCHAGHRRTTEAIRFALPAATARAARDRGKCRASAG